jgi:hypothetical protein
MKNGSKYQIIALCFNSAAACHSRLVILICPLTIYLSKLAMSFQAVLILAAFVAMVMGQAQPTPFITPPPDGVLRTPVLVTPPVTPPSTTTTSPTTTVTPARATTPEAIVSRQPLTTTPAPVAVVNPLSPIAAPVNPTTTTTVVTSATPLLGQTINCADLINFLRP